MKFSIKQSELTRIVNFCSKIIENKNEQMNPICKYLKISLSKNGNFVYCTNNVISGIYKIEDKNIEIEEFGSTLINNEQLSNIVPRINSEENIKFNKIENSVLTIKTSNLKTELNIVETIYPKFEWENINNTKLKINISILNTIYKQNASIVFNDRKQLKPFSGIFFSTCINNDELVTLATDTYKISYLRQKFNNEFNENIEIIITPGTLGIINSIFKQDEEIIMNIDNENKKIMIETERIKIIDRCVDGVYPKEVVLNAFNTIANTTIKFNKNDMMNGLEIIKGVVKIETNPLVDIEITQNEMALNASSFETGSANYKFDIIEFTGAPIKIRVNVNFLITLLKNINSAKICFQISDNTKPILIFGVDDENFKEMLMPMRINN